MHLAVTQSVPPTPHQHIQLVVKLSYKSQIPVPLISHPWEVLLHEVGVFSLPDRVWCKSPCGCCHHRTTHIQAYLGARIAMNRRPIVVFDSVVVDPRRESAEIWNNLLLLNPASKYIQLKCGSKCVGDHRQLSLMHFGCFLHLVEIQAYYKQAHVKKFAHCTL